MDSEELKTAIKEARIEKDEAKKRYDDAEANLQMWKQSRPNLPWNDPEFIYYQQEVRELRNTYNNL
ncbi:hypothetical protein HK103_004499, partial [Boothiomyces macroporosus]